MARQRTAFRISRSIAGAALVGVGLFVLHENFAAAVTWLNHTLGANRSEALGILPATMLALLQNCAASHQRFLQAFMQHMLVSVWPLLLVVVGTVLSRDSFTETLFPKKIVYLSI
jgi:uncharacterized membrane protein